ncbi:unnamed protein product [Ectocarpus fasciculatus]
MMVMMIMMMMILKRIKPPKHERTYERSKTDMMNHARPRGRESENRAETPPTHATHGRQGKGEARENHLPTLLFFDSGRNRKKRGVHNRKKQKKKRVDTYY